jgi:hypothetical protein
MSADFVSDLDIVDQSTVETPAQLYPAAQWLNGDPKMASAGGVTHTGGLVLPMKYVDENMTPAPGWARTKVTFSSGKQDDVLACPKPRLAVIRTRFRWFVNFNGVTTGYPREALETLVTRYQVRYIWLEQPRLDDVRQWLGGTVIHEDGRFGLLELR